MARAYGQPRHESVPRQSGDLTGPRAVCPRLGLDWLTPGEVVTTSKHARHQRPPVSFEAANLLRWRT